MGWLKFGPSLPFPAPSLLSFHNNLGKGREGWDLGQAGLASSVRDCTPRDDAFKAVLRGELRLASSVRDCTPRDDAFKAVLRGELRLAELEPLGVSAFGAGKSRRRRRGPGGYWGGQRRSGGGRPA